MSYTRSLTRRNPHQAATRPVLTNAISTAMQTLKTDERHRHVGPNNRARRSNAAVMPHQWRLNAADARLRSARGSSTPAESCRRGDRRAHRGSDRVPSGGDDSAAARSDHRTEELARTNDGNSENERVAEGDVGSGA